MRGPSCKEVGNQTSQPPTSSQVTTPHSCTNLTLKLHECKHTHTHVQQSKDKLLAREGSCTVFISMSNVCNQLSAKTQLTTETLKADATLMLTGVTIFSHMQNCPMEFLSYLTDQTDCSVITTRDALIIGQ